MNKKNTAIKAKITEKFSKRMFSQIVLATVLEFGPVIIFLVSSQTMRIYGATLLLMIATIFSTVITYHLQKRIPYLALYVAAITLLFGSLTLHFHNVKFIQMRDTMYDATCALTLITGIMVNIPFLKIAFDKVIPMSNNAWNKLTQLWVGYFILLAISNEIIRRNFPLHFWLDYKGLIVFITAIFGFIALYASYEVKVKNELKKDSND